MQSNDLTTLVSWITACRDPVRSGSFITPSLFFLLLVLSHLNLLRPVAPALSALALAPSMKGAYSAFACCMYSGLGCPGVYGSLAVPCRSALDDPCAPRSQMICAASARRQHRPCTKRSSKTRALGISMPLGGRSYAAVSAVWHAHAELSPRTQHPESSATGAHRYSWPQQQAAQRGQRPRLVVVDVEAKRGPRDVGGVADVLLLSDVVPVHVVDHGLAAHGHAHTAESVGRQRPALEVINRHHGRHLCHAKSDVSRRVQQHKETTPCACSSNTGRQHLCWCSSVSPTPNDQLWCYCLLATKLNSQVIVMRSSRPALTTLCVHGLIPDAVPARAPVF